MDHERKELLAQKKEEAKQVKAAPTPQDILLLQEIRDLLKAQKTRSDQ